MFLSFLIGQVEGGLGALRPARVFQAPKGAPVSPRSLPFLGRQPHLRGPPDGKGVTGELCSHPVNQACGHTQLQGKPGTVILSWVTVCPATPWGLHHQKEEAEIRCQEISVQGPVS